MECDQMAMECDQMAMECDQMAMGLPVTSAVFLKATSFWLKVSRINI
jgi:hypothetical protein